MKFDERQSEDPNQAVLPAQNSELSERAGLGALTSQANIAQRISDGANNALSAMQIVNETGGTTNDPREIKTWGCEATGYGRFLSPQATPVDAGDTDKSTKRSAEEIQALESQKKFSQEGIDLLDNIERYATQVEQELGKLKLSARRLFEDLPRTNNGVGYNDGHIKFLEQHSGPQAALAMGRYIDATGIYNLVNSPCY